MNKIQRSEFGKFAEGFRQSSNLIWSNNPLFNNKDVRNRKKKYTMPSSLRDFPKYQGEKWLSFLRHCLLRKVKKKEGK